MPYILASSTDSTGRDHGKGISRICHAV